ncbi:hypothetical protein GWK91_01775 [Virgibacillus sp. MSP4-1]|uniref:hypothetical protein n=1 Tax=Virgibacillus sp. MSP4-1 TaxID=2700081 RepID=UPI0005C58709|nr:hypothetical protein [Virgibacillus sp. MSP4-1]QHS21747.1 hypothetical protein GWK91_01775 [Virgibacillus sp. MSP4-1]
MYVIARKINGKTEILKDTTSPSSKIFSDRSNAETFAKKLNVHTHSSKEWHVMETSSKQLKSIRS